MLDSQNNEFKSHQESLLNETSKKKKELIINLNKLIENFTNDSISSFNTIIEKTTATNKRNKNYIL